MRSRRRRGRRRRRPGRTRRGSGRRGRRMRPRRRSVYPRPAVVGSRRRRSGEGLRASREHRRGCENSGYLSYSSPKWARHKLSPRLFYLSYSSPKWARHKLSPRLFTVQYFYFFCCSARIRFTVFRVRACAEASSASAQGPVWVQVYGFPGPVSPLVSGRVYGFRASLQVQASASACVCRPSAQVPVSDLVSEPP